MFGSSIGALSNGYRGYHAGRAIGMLAGGAVGAAVTAEKPSQAQRHGSDYERSEYYYDEPSYGNYTRTQAPRYLALESLAVENVHFADGNGNRALDSYEDASLEMEIHNLGDRSLHNIAPVITCSNKKVLISPAAIIETIPAGGGVRYKAAIRGPRKLKEEYLLFSVAFGEKKNRVVTKRFKVRAGE